MQEHKPTVITVRLPSQLLKRIDAEVEERRKTHHGWYAVPTRSSVVRAMLERELDRADRLRAQQKKLPI